MAQSILLSNKLLTYTGIIVFTASWCGPCKGYKELIKDSDVPHVIYDIEGGLPEGMEIFSIPTTAYLRDGVSMDVVTGSMSLTKFINFYETTRLDKEDNAGEQGVSTES